MIENILVVFGLEKTFILQFQLRRFFKGLRKSFDLKKKQQHLKSDKKSQGFVDISVRLTQLLSVA